jgi:hypothetical protein
MDNPETLATLGTIAHLFRFLCCLSSSCVLCTQCCQCLWIVHSWLPLRFSLTFICFVCGQSRMDNPEKLETLGTQDTGRRQTKQINVRENRSGNEEWTIQNHWQHWVHKTWLLLRFSLTFICCVCLRPVSCVPNVASVSCLSIPDFPFLIAPSWFSGQEWTSKRNWQHWVHKTRDEDKQNK